MNTLADLQTQADDLNAAFKAAQCPLMARPSKRAVKFYRYYADGVAAYSISRGEASACAHAHGITAIPRPVSRFLRRG